MIWIFNFSTFGETTLNGVSSDEDGHGKEVRPVRADPPNRKIGGRTPVGGPLDQSRDFITDHFCKKWSCFVGNFLLKIKLLLWLLIWCIGIFLTFVLCWCGYFRCRKGNLVSLSAVSESSTVGNFLRLGIRVCGLVQWMKVRALTGLQFLKKWPRYLIVYQIQKMSAHKFYRYLFTLQFPKNSKTWLLTILKNTRLDQIFVSRFYT